LWIHGIPGTTSGGAALRSLFMTKVTFPHVRFSCAIRYDTVRHVTEKFRHTNKLEGLFPHVRLRYDAVRYDTARFFLSQGCAIFWEINRAAKGRDVKFSLMTTLFCERKQKKVSQ
jgi:hypothetical protein